MATVPHREGDVRSETSQRPPTRLTRPDSPSGRVPKHYSVIQAVVDPRDGVPNVSEESFFYRNLRVGKNIQAHQGDIGISDASQSIEPEDDAPVTFYDYFLDSGSSQYVVTPLQNLYENRGQPMARKRFPSFPLSGAAGGPLDEQPLRIMEFPTCYCTKGFLEAFSSEHIRNLLNRGDDLRPGVSFQLTLGSKPFSVAISIPYLGVETKISPTTQSAHEPGEASAPGRSRGARRFSWPRESSTLSQNRYPNASYSNQQRDGVGEPFILVHRAGIILLDTMDHASDTERLAIFRSCDDKNSGRVPLLPHQKSTSALDAFLNVLSNTLKSSEHTVLENLRYKASNYSLGFQMFATEPNSPKGEDKLISTSATLSGELSAVIGVAKSQKRYIKDLQEFLTSLNASYNHPKGSLQLSSECQWKEQSKTLSEKICFLLEERQTFLDEANEIFLEVKAIEKSFYQLSTLRASQRLCEETVFEMRRQGRKFRKAWWKRIIPSKEKALTRRSDT